MLGELVLHHGWRLRVVDDISGVKGLDEGAVRRRGGGNDGIAGAGGVLGGEPAGRR